MLLNGIRTGNFLDSLRESSLRLCQKVVIFLLFEPANNVSQFCRIETILLFLEIIIVGNGGEMMTYNAFAASDGMFALSVAIIVAYTVLDGQSAESVR